MCHRKNKENEDNKNGIDFKNLTPEMLIGNPEFSEIYKKVFLENNKDYENNEDDFNCE